MSWMSEMSEYKDEREARLIARVVSLEEGRHRIEGAKGVSVSIDLNLLIDEIVVSPHLPWLMTTISRVCQMKQLDVPVRASRLSHRPDSLYVSFPLLAMVRTEDVDRVEVPREVWVLPEDDTGLEDLAP